ncbi:hypothetical protein CGRA01v4_04205 [Colletotrichum graminicola]|nr:hypothetical protein CGRA01v4_04205 [Colletotrichum graminicola]
MPHRPPPVPCSLGRVQQTCPLRRPESLYASHRSRLSRMRPAAESLGGLNMAGGSVGSRRAPDCVLSNNPRTLWPAFGLPDTKALQLHARPGAPSDMPRAEPPRLKEHAHERTCCRPWRERYVGAIRPAHTSCLSYNEVITPSDETVFRGSKQYIFSQAPAGF